MSGKKSCLVSNKDYRYKLNIQPKNNQLSSKRATTL